eukprot:c25018_g1_i1 orf=393-785(+)
MSPMGKGFSVLLSDMCPAVSGVGSRDATLSAELGFRALHLAIGDRALASFDGSTYHPSQLYVETNGVMTQQATRGLLLPGGNIVVKVLEGEDSQDLLKVCKGNFKSVLWLRPKATRSTSREIYLIAKDCR